MIDLTLLIIILSLVTYRVARFLVLDTLIDGTRDRVIDGLERRVGEARDAERKSAVAYEKLIDLIGCPFCITVWVAAGRASSPGSSSARSPCRCGCGWRRAASLSYGGQ